MWVLVRDCAWTGLPAWWMNDCSAAAMIGGSWRGVGWRWKRGNGCEAIPPPADAAAAAAEEEEAEAEADAVVWGFVRRER
uniref:Uncharacterized protein n=1 Tax=Oryza meridionalis TaxID=40149 RepID=A0A0E0DUR1_9ORYZ